MNMGITSLWEDLEAKLLTSHCYIKALFPVLGGGLPKFKKSDLFLGRESLSYMPPDI